MDKIDYEKFVLLIPSLDPDNKLIKLLDDLTQFGFKKFLIVNDGSKPENEHFFNEAQEKFGCLIFKHHKNFGKGRALKNAFNFLLTEYKNFNYVITLDSDGQHTPKDVNKMAKKLLETKNNELVLGCRHFGEKKIPFRSKFGNILTRNILKVLCGVKTSDTQTGLRGFSKELLNEFLDVPGERFEYEMNMLISTKQKEIKIVECPIETVYLENNKSSHFNPLLDSFRIYSLFFKFIVASLIGFVVDLAFFALFSFLFKKVSVGFYIYIATVLARIISAIVNFMINKNNVFKKSGNNSRFVIGYIILASFIMIASAVFVNLLVKGLGWNDVLSKLLVDMVLFVVSYTIQRDIIFKNRRIKNG